MVRQYTQVNSKLGSLTRRRPDFEPGFAAPKQLNLKSLAPGSQKKHLLLGGVQAGSKAAAVRRSQNPSFEFICV